VEVQACSGCGRGSGDVKKMLAAHAPTSSGTALGVCDECVRDCVRAIADAPTRVPGRNRVCSFCALSEGQVAVLLVLGRELICDECVDAYRVALGHA
jgi:hypothetical protein